MEWADIARDIDNYNYNGRPRSKKAEVGSLSSGQISLVIIIIIMGARGGGILEAGRTIIILMKRKKIKK